MMFINLISEKDLSTKEKDELINTLLATDGVEFVNKKYYIKSGGDISVGIEDDSVLEKILKVKGVLGARNDELRSW